MNHRTDQVGNWLATLLPMILLGAWASPAAAGLIASESYEVGSAPTLGQYTVNPASTTGTALRLQPADLTTPGFAAGSYNQGSGTSNFTATLGGLSYPPLGTPSATDGKATWLGAPADGATRSVARALSPAAASSSTYWFHILVSQDGATAPGTNGYVLGGFGNSVAPLLGTSAGNTEGLYFGFAQHGVAGSSGDLVIRYRGGASQNSDAVLVNGASTSTARVFDIVARLDVNLNGGSTDYLTYWVNPTDFSSQAALTATALVTNDTGTGPLGSLATLAFQTPALSLQRLTYSATNWTGRANFDELRLGTTLADVAPGASPTPVPEPASVALLGLGLAGGLVAAGRRSARR